MGTSTDTNFHDHDGSFEIAATPFREAAPSSSVEGDADVGQRFRGSFEISPDYRYFVSNRTPYLIQIVHPDDRFGELHIPPLAERVVKGDRLQPFEDLLRPHRQRHEVLVRRYVETISFVDTLIWVAWLSLAVVAGIAIFDILRFGTLLRSEFGVAAAIGVVVLAVLLVAGAVRELDRKKRASREGSDAGDVAFGIGGSYSDGNQTARNARQFLTLAIVLLVGAAMPTAGVLVATDASDYLVMNGGLRVKSGLESRLVARLIQITYTCVLSLFPALLFFQFDRMRAGSIRSTWVRALFRMDGRMRTVADIDATYGHAMYEASNNSDDSVRGLGGKNSPIVIATILIALGWTVLVIRTESFDFSGAANASQLTLVAEQQAALAATAAEVAANASTEGEAQAAALDAVDAAAAASSAQEATQAIAETSAQTESAPAATVGREVTALGTLEEAQTAANAASGEAEQSMKAAAANEETIQATPYFQILAPDPSAAGMAFLGAYFFGIYLVLRSYFRGDLRAKLYNQITARLITVVVIAYLINAILFPSTDRPEIIWGLAFLAGVIPTTVLDGITHRARGMVKSVAGDTFAVNRPLEHIDGIDIYDAGRLEAEGIPDVAALASSDLAAVMLQTRLPIGRIVDWADQAALMVVVGMPGSDLDPRVQCLRTRGIRTGTDLLAACERDGSADELEACLNIPATGRRAGWLDREDSDGASRVGNDLDAAPSDRTESSMMRAGAIVTPAEIASQKVNVVELCQAIRRQPVMAQILQWRSSAIDDPDRSWIRLSDENQGRVASTSYSGPLPGAANLGGRNGQNGNARN
ncbi:hypothetical protein [Ilumatobacter sp.]|uniref:hypothetical protein n=1 Tax=Ilumatobacter sp. TaxID=1967498 RepID=UPI003C6A83F3